MTKMVKVLVLVAILTATLAVSPAQACACGEDWSKMNDEEIVSNIPARYRRLCPFHRPAHRRETGAGRPRWDRMAAALHTCRVHNGGGGLPGRDRLARTPSGRAPWPQFDCLWHSLGNRRVGSLGPLALPGRAPRVRHSGRRHATRLTGRHRPLPLPLLAQVGEPHGARVRARHGGLGAKRPRDRFLAEAS